MRIPVSWISVGFYIAAMTFAPPAKADAPNPLIEDWQAVTSADSAGRQKAALEWFWVAHLQDRETSLRLHVIDTRNDQMVPVGNLDPEQVSRYEVRVIVDDRQLRFRPLSIGAVHILLRE